MTIRNLDALLAPRSVVLVGAGKTPGSVGHTIARNMLRAGFTGETFLVNPKHTEIEGQACHPSIAALPSAPDLAIVATPPATVPGVIAELAAKGTRAAVVITAGLDEAATNAMLEAGRSRLFRILGPNCIGMMLPQLRLDASFAYEPPAAGDLAFISQSGALVTSVVDWAAKRKIGFSHVLSLGNMADVDFGDLLDYLAGDRSCRAILLYMEALTHAPKFMSAARRAARAKPVVVIKSGRNETAAKAAASHTGRLAGSDAAYDAAFRRAGILRVYDLPELFDAAEVLARAPRLRSERLTIMTNGGGAGVLAADRLADFDGRLADLSTETRDKLDAVLPPTWSKANPVDIIGDAGVERTIAAFEILLADPDPSTILAINCPTALASSTDIATAFVAAVERHRATAAAPKPILANWLGSTVAEPAREMFAEAGIASFETPGDAVRGLMQIVRYNRAQDELMQTPAAMTDGGINPAVATEILDRVFAEGRSMLTEPEAKSVVAAYGIPVVESASAADPAEVEAIAQRMIEGNGSVVVKILSRDITHKSDVGGVALDIKTAQDARAIATRMQAKIAERHPTARMDGFTVSPMVRRPRSHELIVGLSVDPTFGPLVMFGAGGTAVEVIRDTALALPPLDLRLAHDVIRATHISRLLEGYRDRPPAALDAIAETLVRISQLVADQPMIKELDLNPLLADDRGVIALDARIGIGLAHEPARTAMAIRPYPSAWEKTIELGTLGPVFLRPIKPEDEHLYEAFMAKVDPDDHRLRFFSAKQRLSHKLLARLTQIDYARDMAFVAIAPATGELLGVSRYSAEPDRQNAEYAVMVRSDLKGQGLGWALMRHLIDHAAVTKVGHLYGSVLAANTTMLQMCRELGFTLEIDPDDASLTRVRLDLPKL